MGGGGWREMDSSENVKQGVGSKGYKRKEWSDKRMGVRAGRGFKEGE